MDPRAVGNARPADGGKAGLQPVWLWRAGLDQPGNGRDGARPHGLGTRVHQRTEREPVQVRCAPPQRCGARLNSVSGVMRLSRLKEWAIVKAKAPPGV